MAQRGRSIGLGSKHPDDGYAFAWPDPAEPELGTWARKEAGSKVVVVGYNTSRWSDLSTLVLHLP